MAACITCVLELSPHREPQLLQPLVGGPGLDVGGFASYFGHIPYDSYSLAHVSQRAGGVSILTLVARAVARDKQFVGDDARPELLAQEPELVGQGVGAALKDVPLHFILIEHQYDNATARPRIDTDVDVHEPQNPSTSSARSVSSTLNRSTRVTQPARPSRHP